MGDTWITDLTHFLNEDGSFPANIPGPALNLALFLAADRRVGHEPRAG